MQTKPILIGFAAAILILVVAGASFSAGLYLGQRGYVDGLRSQPQNSGLPADNPLPSGPANGQPNPNGLNPASGPPGAPTWPADLMGRFVSKTADTIVIEGPQRQFTISVNADTRYTDENGNAIDPSIFQAGDTLAVFGRDVATLIMRLPPRPTAP
ncbi:MAG: hypothetical protein ACOYZ6_05755 [Chloroflexota bacterium]